MTHALALPMRDPMAAILQEIERDPKLKSANSRRGYVADLRAFNGWREGRPISKLLVEQYAAELQRQGKSPNSINRSLAAIRWWARRMGDLAAEDLQLDPKAREQLVGQTERVIRVEDVRGERLPKGRHIQDAEVRALLKACGKDRTAAGRRDAALVALAWNTGARRAEIAAVCLEQVQLAESGDYQVTLRGKGDKTRTAYVNGQAAKLLGAWLKRRGAQPGPVFCPIRKNGSLAVGLGLSTEALAMVLRKRQEAAGIDPLTWHDFRRTFAGNAFQAGIDPVIVQKLMGHASLSTTGNYDRRGEDAQRQAMRQLRLPI